MTESETAMTAVMDVVRTIRKLRAESNVPRSQRLDCEIRGGPPIPPWTVADARRYIEHLGNVRIISNDF